MNKLENTGELLIDEQTAERKPIIKWYPYFLINGNLKEKELKQQFEIADCPTRDDVEAAIVESVFHPAGKYRVEKKKGGQPTSDYFYCEKPEASFFQQTAQKPIIRLEPDFERLEQMDGEQLNPQMEDLITRLIQKVEDLEDRLQDHPEPAPSSSNETVMLSVLREMQKQGERNLQQSEKSFQQGLQMAQMMLQSQQQPQQNPTELMLSMLKGTLEVQRGVRELSEEIAPNDSGGGSSLIADGAKLLDSLGRNASTFLPLLSGALGGNRQTAQPAQPSPTTSNGNGNSNLAETFAKIKNSEIKK
jgi:hypothetical protein